MLYKSQIHPVLEYGSILYSRVALYHLNCLHHFQARVENMCGLTFPYLTNHHSASILGLNLPRIGKCSSVTYFLKESS